MIPGSANPLLLKSAAAAGGYQVSRSLRFNSSDSGFCSRTPAVAGNRRTWTWAGWVKRSALGTKQQIFGVTGVTDADYCENYFGSDDKLYLRYGYNTVGEVVTTQVFRDPSSWYHILFAFDVTQATAANRLRLYVNGVEVTTFSTDTRSTLTNTDWAVNRIATHYISGSPNGGGTSEGVSGYLADIHFIDGQALTPSSFTEVSATTGQLIPLAYSGSFGTNGFWLKFSDNSNNTAATLGKDYSPNGNNWTPNNLSVTAGAGNDSLVDTPTSFGTDTGVGNEVRGNYCTWNPLQSSAATLANGNLDCTTSVGTGAQTRGTIAVSTGKWYWEVTVNTSVTANNIGIIKTSEALAADRPSYFAGGYAYVGSSGNKENNASASAYGATYGSGDVIGVALDLTAGTLVFYKNGASQGTAFSSLSGEFIPAIGDGTGGSGMDISANFGQRAFAYQTPGTNRPAATFLALCDTNLGAPLVAKPNTLMDVALYTGNGAANTITGLAFSPDLVWMKVRSTAYNHTLIDSVRGATKTLSSSMTVQEYTEPTGPTAFTADGWSMSGDVTYVGSVNASGQTYVGWAWDAGTTTASNGSGSITSQVRANASAGFSIATFSTNSSSGNATIGHGLGVAPKFVILKSRNAAYNWDIYHGGISNAKDGRLIFTTAAFTTSFVPFGGVDPTSSVFTVSQSFYGTAIDCVAYCFSPVVGYSSVSSYVGNGSSDGPFVYTGFRPRWIMIKRSDSTEQWYINDAARDDYNVTGKSLRAQSSGAEASVGGSNSSTWDILSN